MRLDKYILQKFFLKSRTYAENLILTGKVSVDGNICLKPAFDASDENDVVIVDDESYASQGAYKLEAAMDGFGIDARGLFCLDVGCSNGGFTDVLLRRGAKSVLAIDVGECALPPQILASGKVTFLRANARALPQEIPQADFLCSDLSFISLKLVLGEFYKALKPSGRAVVLVKPQFELGRGALNKKGIVTSEKLRAKALDDICDFAEGVGFEKLATMTSPIRFSEKNVEFLLYLQKPAEA